VFVIFWSKVSKEKFQQRGIRFCENPAVPLKSESFAIFLHHQGDIYAFTTSFVRKTIFFGTSNCTALPPKKLDA